MVRLCLVYSTIIIIIIIIIIIKDINIAQVRKGHKCAMSAEMTVWLRNCLRRAGLSYAVERGLVVDFCGQPHYCY